MKRTLVLWLLVGLTALMFLPSLALAAVPQPTLALSKDQTWIALIGAMVPAATYLLNHYGFWVAEPVKTLVLVAVSGASGALYRLVEAGTLALNATTLQYIGTAVVAAFVAHFGFWKPSGLSAKLKAGTNAQHKKRR